MLGSRDYSVPAKYDLDEKTTSRDPIRVTPTLFTSSLRGPNNQRMKE